MGQAPWFLHDLIRLPASAISLRPLPSLDRHNLVVPQVRASMAQTRGFAIIGPALWNQLPPSTRSFLLTDDHNYGCIMFNFVVPLLSFYC